ncbi:hypothetical protein BS78_K238300 [Paspalum vaginatum]|uniref:TTF-type domain-containing protein n=1 Tax=Paspalum vaginatum TaxID=158149 RepID=A0A9W7XBL4_9POAL|nr:hypothetical protein BS78_K238300 [Paspalum vaginatum]
MWKRTLFNYYSSGSSTTLQNEENTRQPKLPRVEFRSSDIVCDPGMRKPIEEYPFEIRDQVKKAYVLRGPTQVVGYTFPCKWQSGDWRSFQPHWFQTYDWLEYSESKDAAFCLYCYLFFEPGKPDKFGCNVFAKVGYEKWKKALERFDKHAASLSHNNARMKCDDFMNQKRNIARFLIMQGDAFRGHDESSISLNKGTYRELLDWYKDKVEVVKDAYDNGNKNCQMVSNHIQKDLTKACSEEVMAIIMDEIRGMKFSVLIDESRDVSMKEQMAMILRFVNDEGKVLERFVGLQHVERCTAAALKEALVHMLSSLKLSISMFRGQGYDGASNMRDENPYAFYVHCFAHQLQLVVVTVSTSTPAIADFFNYVPLIVNAVGASCMRKDALLAKHHDTLVEEVESGEILTGRGLNQESSLARPGDTRWGSHLKTLLRILVMWEAIIDVLDIVKKDSIKPACNGGAFGLISKMESFNIVFILHLMIELLSMTDMLSRALQRKDQDIVEAMHFILGVKDKPLLKRVKTFCAKNEIEVPDMDKKINAGGTSTRRRQKVTNMHFYHVEIFLAAVDAILSEMNHRFGEVSSELLVCMASLNPRNPFSNFDVDKLIRLAEIYAEDFNIGEIALLPSQFKDFIRRVRKSQEFLGCTELPRCAEIMVQAGMHRSYPLVYRLIELTLILPVATASVERVSSAMSIIKTDLHNKMGDEWLNDLMICYTEKEMCRSISNEKNHKTI